MSIRMLGVFLFWVYTGSTLNGEEIVAVVGNETITAAEVQHDLMRNVLGDGEFDDSAIEVLRAATLEKLIRQRLVFIYLQSKGAAASTADVDLEVARVKKKLAQEEKTLADFLQQSKLTEEQFRKHLAWNTTWSRYLAASLTAKNLQRHFDDNHRQFDGTRLHIAHILLKTDKNATAEEIEKQVQRAGDILQSIKAGDQSFAAAAKKFSQSPTAAKGGDIGSIQRHGSMVESFAAAAFELQKGETSEPVVSPFGVHLIHCLEVQPGQVSYERAKDSVANSATEYLFEWASNRQAKSTKIEFRDSFPHFKWGTRKLVLPAREANAKP